MSYYRSNLSSFENGSSYQSANFKFKSSQKENFGEKSDNSFEPKRKRSRFLVYVGNVMTIDLTDEEIEDLIRKTAASSVKADLGETARKPIEILSVKVFLNCFYIELADESIAKAIAQGLNNQTFKSNRIQAYCLDKLEKESDFFTRNKRDVQQFLEKNESTKSSTANLTSSGQSQIDCELVVLDRQLRKYADSVNDKLKSSLFGLSTRVTYLHNETPEEDVTQSSSFVNEKLEDAAGRNLLYLIFINHPNEQFNSLSLYVINNSQEKNKKSKLNEISVKENKNMPLNRALDFLKSDYYNYISFLKKSTKQSLKSGGDDDSEDECEQGSDEESSDNERKDKGNASGKIFKFNKKQKKFLKLLLKPIISERGRNDSIKLNDLDRLLTYLSRQKSNLINATLSSPASLKNEEPPAVPAAPLDKNVSQPIPLLSMQINPSEMALSALTQQAVQMAQIPSLLSMPYQLPPPLLNQAASIPPSLLQANLLQQYQLLPNFGIGLAGPGSSNISLLGQYPTANNPMPGVSQSMSSINTSTAPPSLMSIQPSSGSSSGAQASSAAPSLMSVQPSSLMNLSLPNFMNQSPSASGSALNSSLLGNPPPNYSSYLNKSNNSTPGGSNSNFKQQR